MSDPPFEAARVPLGRAQIQRVLFVAETQGPDREVPKPTTTPNGYRRKTPEDSRYCCETPTTGCAGVSDVVARARVNLVMTSQA